MRDGVRGLTYIFLAAGLLALATGAQGANRCYTSDFLKSECPHVNFEGAIPHANWETRAAEKLAAFDGVGTTNKPNILVIYVDDMGWADPGVYGGGTALGAPTPNIDALAARGLRMTSAYSQPACTPTRAAWQTGRLPQRTGLTRPTAAGEDNEGMAGETTIAQILRDNDYRTGMAGKWHLGEKEGTWPTDVGYDEYYGNLSVNTAYHDWRDPSFSPELVYDQDRIDAMNAILEIKTTVHSFGDAPDGTTGTKSFPEEIDLDCSDDDTGDQVPDPTSCEQMLEKNYLNWSLGFIAQADRDRVPFFLYHAMNKVHTKNHPHEDYRGKSPAGTPFRDGMLEIDDVVGQLVAAVDALETETFIFFTSDNGAEEDVHAGGINTSDSGHHPWRGAKGTTWEGGVRVSAIAVWDTMIEPGRVSDGLFDHMDLFNTLARLGGEENLAGDYFPPQGFPGASLKESVPPRYVDGIDQTSWLLYDDQVDLTGVTLDAHGDLPDIEDPQQTSNREAVYYWYGQDFYGVRWAEFKRMERVMTVGMSVGPQTYGGLFNATKSETSDPTMGWYFNLYSDPKERMPITRTWNIGTLNELSTHSKMTFVNYPEAPRGVMLNGYLVRGPAGGVLFPRLRKEILAGLEGDQIRHGALPD